MDEIYEQFISTKFTQKLLVHIYLVLYIQIKILSLVLTQRLSR